jgi:hypothetical protein
LSKLDLSEPFEIIDLVDQNGVAVGTKVVLHLPIL